ncbi:MAG: tRNA epoxyqueuosine(34) reductase QueG [Chthoniobacteraceae bacterium]|nr:tRNA epoxyqueuosine(34) reductase QueG [Chthoniobacteraceae bacterium]
MEPGVLTEPEALKRGLAELARSLGFALCRVAPAVEPPHAGAFRRWIAEGCAGEMAWMERNAERRVDPQAVLPGARSVVVLALPYFQGPGEIGGIARYAWNEDYHDLIAPKLRRLDDFLQEHGGVQRSYADTGPVLERDFAALAGAGWQGKSTMLIHPELGAWFFLAEVLTTLVLPPDAPLPERCGRCTRCLDACPTGALTGPHRLDARRCIAYLTIELKGSIPEELRPLIGGRIYGCDACAAACPWNRFAQSSREAAFAARPGVTMGPRELLALDDEAFRALFKGSPIKRIKRRGLLRNVCVALGNTGTREDLPALERAAADPEPLIAEHAAWAVARIRRR